MTLNRFSKALNELVLLLPINARYIIKAFQFIDTNISFNKFPNLTVEHLQSIGHSFSYINRDLSNAFRKY